MPTPTITPNPHAVPPAQLFANAASRYVGKHYREGVPAQCMNFVRAVLDDVHYPLADVVTAEPLDHHSTGPALASSLAGRDIGAPILRIDDLLPGDLLFFNDTYETGYPPDTITHVAISLGKSLFVHRPTKSAPVRTDTIDGFWYSAFRCGIRVNPKLFASTPAPATDPEPARKAWKVFVGGEKLSKLIDTVPIDAASGRAIMTAQVIAALTGRELIINNEEKAIRFAQKL